MAENDLGSDWTKRIKGLTVVHLFFFVTFMLSSLTINAIQFVLFCTLRLLNEGLYRRINNFLLWMIHSQVLFVATWWSGSELRVRGPPSMDLKELWHLFDQKSVIIMNHHYDVDWIFTWMFADYFDGLDQGRTMAKKILRFIPPIGWAWAMSDFIFLERDWSKDQGIITDSLTSLMRYQGGLGILVFPEGTRLSHKKLEASQKYARENGLPELHHHLVPRTKGLVHILKTVDRTKLTMYVDVLLGVHPKDGAPATLSSLLNGDKVVGDFYIRVYPTADLPEDEEGLRDFIMKTFEERDRLLDNYKREEGTSFSGEAPLLTITRKPWVLVNTVVLNLAVCGTLLYKAVLASLTSSPLFLAAGVAVMVALNFAMRKLIDLTRIDKASDYGSKALPPKLADKKAA